MSTEFSTIFGDDKPRLDVAMFEGPRAGSRVTIHGTRAAGLDRVKWSGDGRRPGQLDRSPSKAHTMPTELKLWQIDNQRPRFVPRQKLDLPPCQ